VKVLLDGDTTVLPASRGRDLFVCSALNESSTPLRRLEPYGLMILIAALFILPLLGAQLGVDLNVVWQLVQHSTKVIIDAILWLTGNA
jgi:hypothetical protein